MRPKRNLICSTHCDLDLSTLGQIEPSKIINSNIYISEALNLYTFNTFQNLKEVAKLLGFKYIWHRLGAFLAKWDDGEKAHVFATVADLGTIALSYKSVSSGKSSATKSD